MGKTIIISITVIITTLLLCFTAIHINYIKIEKKDNYSISGNGRISDPYILKDLKTGEIYTEKNGYWESEVKFKNRR